MVDETIEVLLAIAIVVPLALLWVAVIIDVYRRTDLSVLRKIIWTAVAILFVHVGVLIYFIVRPPGEPHGKRTADTVDRSHAIVRELERLHRAHRAGDLDDGAYLRRKREILGLPA